MSDELWETFANDTQLPAPKDPPSAHDREARIEWKEEWRHYLGENNEASKWAERLNLLAPIIREYINLSSDISKPPKQYILSWHYRDKDGGISGCEAIEFYDAEEEALVRASAITLTSPDLPGYLFDLAKGQKAEFSLEQEVTLSSWEDL